MYCILPTETDKELWICEKLHLAGTWLINSQPFSKCVKCLLNLVIVCLSLSTIAKQIPTELLSFISQPSWNPQCDVTDFLLSVTYFSLCFLFVAVFTPHSVILFSVCLCITVRASGLSLWGQKCYLMYCHKYCMFVPGRSDLGYVLHLLSSVSHN